MANENIKKFLDQEGVSLLWSKVVENITVEADRAKAAEKVNADAIAAEAARAALVEATNAEAAAAAQKTADDLADLVGNIPTDENGDAVAATVIAYVDKKTEGIATDAAVAELQGKVKTIEDDYLQAADIADMATKTEAAATYETIANADLVRSRVAELEAHKDDYQAYADQAEADAKAYADEVKKSILTGDAQEELKDTYDTLIEIQNWIEGAGVNATELTEAIAGETSRAEDAESALSGRLDVLEAIDHEAYIAADTALKNELNSIIATKATNADLEALENKVDNKQIEEYFEVEGSQFMLFEEINSNDTIYRGESARYLKHPLYLKFVSEDGNEQIIRESDTSIVKEVYQEYPEECFKFTFSDPNGSIVKSFILYEGYSSVPNRIEDLVFTKNYNNITVYQVESTIVKTLNEKYIDDSIARIDDLTELDTKLSGNLTELDTKLSSNLTELDTKLTSDLEALEDKVDNKQIEDYFEGEKYNVLFEGIISESPIKDVNPSNGVEIKLPLNLKIVSEDGAEQYLTENDFITVPNSDGGSSVRWSNPTANYNDIIISIRFEIYNDGVNNDRIGNIIFNDQNSERFGKTFTIYQLETFTKTLNEKYIPDSIARTADIQALSEEDILAIIEPKTEE